MSNSVPMSGLARVRGTRVTAPPGWALLQRRLLDTVAEAAPLFVEKYADPGGVFYYSDDVDDIYELFYNWGLCYAVGGDQTLLGMAQTLWNATTRFFDDRVTNRVHPRFSPQIHNEYYNSTEWHHQGEGNMPLYDFGVADPTISENIRRAKRFAAMFTGDDPEAPNYDAEHRVFRSPFQTSRGPIRHSSSADEVHRKLLGGAEERLRYYGVRASLHPIVKDLEEGWYEDPQRREEIVRLYNEILLSEDGPQSLCATALVTNAYLYTGDEKYRRWVLDYVEGWIDRMRRNGGIMPDNAGPTGKGGEHRRGQWWGGYYGWNSRASGKNLLHGLVVGAECALLLSGDFGYLDMLRSQLQLLMDNSIVREDGQRLWPHRYGPGGWGEFRPPRIIDMAHLWHASMAPEDYKLIAAVRDGDVERDWDHEESFGEKNNREGISEYARFQYYDGVNPGWPDKIMGAELQFALTALDSIRRDSRDVETIVAENMEPVSPVLTKGLTQMTMGAPHTLYNGGLLCARVRYFDQDRRRPGLPPDVAALVYRLEPERVGVELVNTSTSATRNLIVQAGAFGEHHFTEIGFEDENPASAPIDPYLRWQGSVTHARRSLPVDSKHFAVELPPSTGVRLDAGMHRFVNRPSYAFPWHRDAVPVAFP